MRAYILDDEPIAVEILEKFVSRESRLELAGSSSDPEHALSELPTLKPELIFLDINMPEINGFDLLQILGNQKPLIIITSAYPEFALKGFEYEVLDYLLKPIPFERFQKAVDKAEKQFKLLTPTESNNQINPLYFKVDGVNIRVDPEEISNIEGFGDYVKIYFSSNSKKFLLTRISMNEMIKLLPENNFIRVHRSHIINSDSIDFMAPSFIRLKSEVNIPVGKTYRAKVKNYKKAISGN